MEFINELEILIEQLILNFSLSLKNSNTYESSIKKITTYNIKITDEFNESNNNKSSSNEIIITLFNKIEEYIKENYSIEQYLKFIKDFKLSNQYYNIKRNIIFIDGFIAEGKTELTNNLFNCNKEGSLLVFENDKFLREKDKNDKTILKDNQQLIIYLYLYKLYHACESSFVNLFVDRSIFSQLCFDENDKRYKNMIQLFCFVIYKNPNDNYILHNIELKKEIESFNNERQFEKELYIDMIALSNKRIEFYNKYDLIIKHYIKTV